MSAKLYCYDVVCASTGLICECESVNPLARFLFHSSARIMPPGRRTQDTQAALALTLLVIALVVVFSVSPAARTFLINFAICGGYVLLGLVVIIAMVYVVRKTLAKRGEIINSTSHPHLFQSRHPAIQSLPKA